MKKNTVILTLFLSFLMHVLVAGEGYQEEIPVKAVTLYTAGLAWVVHEAQVTDDEILYFNVEHSDINDVLKSLVVEDLGGGTIDSINFDSENPLAATLSDLRVNPSGSPALFDFLKRTQGETVRIETDDYSLVGRIFSVEKKSIDESEKTYLNLMDSEGIKTVEISALKNLSFEDLTLQEELLSALDLISRSRVKTARTIKLSFRGSGARTVRLSYIRAVPLWKTSYRINIDQKGNSRLEGWALVQNTGSKDWRDVSLSFVAGRPNAFTMDLATPRYVTRQAVQTAAQAPLGATRYEKAYEPMRSEAPSEAFGMLMDMEEEMVFAESEYSPSPVAPQATGESSGNFYRYTVNQLVSVDARSSAMIPILLEEETGDSLAVFDPAYNLVFKGLRLKNATEAHWAAGPVSITEGRFYGGDAMLPEMIPQSERLLTYAVHGAVELSKVVEETPQRMIAITMVDGLLTRTDKRTRETIYHIDGEENELLILHPKSGGWNLVQHPEIAEETNTQYRFTLSSWEKPVSVVEEYISRRQYNLISMRISDINEYLSWEGTSEGMKEAFKEIAALISHKERIRTEINTLNSRLTRLERDQNRVRENMKVLDSESDLYIRYSEQLDEQETEIRQIDADLDIQQQNLNDADQKLREYISSLDLE